MGCPTMYYNECIQQALVNLNVKKWDDFHTQKYSENELIKMLNDAKSKTKNDKFIFECGVAMGMVFERAYNENNTDGFNACCGGVIDFEYEILGEPEDD